MVEKGLYPPLFFHPWMVLHNHRSHHVHQGHHSHYSHHSHPVLPRYTFLSMDGTFRVADQLHLRLTPPHPWMELRALSALPVSKSYTPSIDGTVRWTSGSTGALGVEAIPPPIDEPLPIDGTRSSVE